MDDKPVFGLAEVGLAVNTLQKCPNPTALNALPCHETRN